MAGITLEKGKVIYKCGQPMTALHLITDGKVTVNYPGGSYQIGKGDVIGICEICFEVHLVEYTVAEDASILTYPMSGINMLTDLLQKHADVARLFLLSACRQISALQNHCSLSELNCMNLYSILQEDLETYNRIGSFYRQTPRSLPGMEELNAFISDENPDLWLNDYYLALCRLYKGDFYREFLKEPAVSLGILRKGSLDYRKTWMGIEEQFRYLEQISSFYFNESGEDLFEFLTALYYKLDPDTEEQTELYASIQRVIHQFETLSVVPRDLLNRRVEQFQNSIAEAAAPAQAPDETAEVTLPEELAGSLNIILEFAGEEFAESGSFRQHVHSYKQLSDKNAMEDEAPRLRRVLTDEFYSLYTIIFKRTLGKTNLPAPVRMFLYFGYVDEELAGTACSAVLLELLSAMTDNSSSGFYTFYDWLMAVYNGQKEPSRNEFEEDYTDHIHKQKARGNITDAQMKALEKDNMAKVEYELQNMFQSVNKISFGRVTTFCPLFTEENVLKDLKASYVTVSKVNRAVEQVRKIDFSAFYRPSLDTENVNTMGKESIHRECLPDIILMPNAGIRGVMWQEIEGKRRNTPARMIFSIFFMEDLTSSFLRMTGEFRWEMCRRIQGARWNDLSERSLTSEYFDYVQFYKKNRDLSNEAKERVRTSLQRAKNSYKEMFVRDYVVWILFEGNASPRLNKVARKILFTYCPFSADICSVLEQNPLYGELLQYHKLQRARNIHRLDTLRKKLLNSGTPIPDTLEEELRFYHM